MYNVGTIHFTNIHFLKTASKKREIERETERERELNQLKARVLQTQRKREIDGKRNTERELN